MGHMVVVVVDRCGRLGLGCMALGMDVVLGVVLGVGMVLGMVLGMVVVLGDYMVHMGCVVGMVVGMGDGILVHSMDRMGCRSSI